MFAIDSHHVIVCIILLAHIIHGDTSSISNHLISENLPEDVSENEKTLISPRLDYVLSKRSKTEILSSSKNDNIKTPASKSNVSLPSKLRSDAALSKRSKSGCYSLHGGSQPVTINVNVNLDVRGKVKCASTKDFPMVWENKETFIKPVHLKSINMLEDRKVSRRLRRSKKGKGTKAMKKKKTAKKKHFVRTIINFLVYFVGYPMQRFT